MGRARSPVRDARRAPRRPVPPPVVGDRGVDGPRGRHRGRSRRGGRRARRLDRRSSRHCPGARRRPNPRIALPGSAPSCWPSGFGCLAFSHRQFADPNPVLIIVGHDRDHVRDVVRRAALYPCAGHDRPPGADRVAARAARSRPLPSPIGRGVRSHQPRARDCGDRRDQRGGDRDAGRRRESREQPTHRLPERRQRLTARQRSRTRYPQGRQPRFPLYNPESTRSPRRCTRELSSRLSRSPAPVATLLRPPRWARCTSSRAGASARASRSRTTSRSTSRRPRCSRTTASVRATSTRTLMSSPDDTISRASPSSRRATVRVLAMRLNRTAR